MLKSFVKTTDKKWGRRFPQTICWSRDPSGRPRVSSNSFQIETKTVPWVGRPCGCRKDVVRYNDSEAHVIPSFNFIHFVNQFDYGLQIQGISKAKKLIRRSESGTILQRDSNEWTLLWTLLQAHLVCKPWESAHAIVYITWAVGSSHGCNGVVFFFRSSHQEIDSAWCRTRNFYFLSRIFSRFPSSEYIGGSFRCVIIHATPSKASLST